jgi:hypothetical protein
MYRIHFVNIYYEKADFKDQGGAIQALYSYLARLFITNLTDQ